MSDVFTCKDCGKSGDYEDIAKTMDPRPNARRVICQDCALRHKRDMSRSQLLAPYQRKSSSSKDGARAAAHKVEPQALQVLEALSEASDGLTEPQVTFILDMDRNESTRAISGLWQNTPYAIKADFKRKNPATGISVQVYQITEAGRSYLAQARRAA